MARMLDPSLDRRIHQATVELLGREGYERMTVDAVAAHAGVGKAAIYRRHRSKEDLVIGAVNAVLPVVEPPASSNGRDALAAIVEDLRVALFEAGGVGLLTTLLTDSSNDGGLAALWRRNVVGPRVALLARVLRRTGAAPDTDPQLIGELALGGLVARRLGRGRVTADDARDLAADLWRFAANGPTTMEESHEDDAR